MIVQIARLVLVMAAYVAAGIVLGWWLRVMGLAPW